MNAGRASLGGSRALVAAIATTAAVTTTAWADPRCDGERTPSTRPSRFIDHDDGTVTDARSKLMWMRCSIGQRWTAPRCAGPADRVAYDDASASATALNRSGSMFYNDWRLPKLPELASLAERGCDEPRIDAVVFPDTPAETYWSSTERPGRASGTTALPANYALGFGADGVHVSSRDDAHHVRLVRTDR